MTAYRLAVFTGNSTRLSACYIHHYQELTACSYSAAVAQANRLNALVIGWRTVSC